ncbi:phage holin family protein [Blastococcus sp. PRF04-17]|uniref:phage holin family protein n=1 Tax=Blastococcus sp. PRF04-17 TaxID=2933797 RepID=UPI001FF55CA0|nr:phage holin family protein [Blastococcus sp. PRF04-17]UOY00243.1 phage holin family protein [Blastococcus sp. PRF04-17]
MTASPDRGRLLRTGRTIARVLLTWSIAAGALVALDAWLSGFAMSDWWHPWVAALLLGLLTAGVWPLVLRVALPLAVFTLGVGGFLLLGAGVLAVFLAIPGVEVHSFKTSVVVAVAMAAVSGLVNSALAVDEDEVFFRRARRQAAAAATPDRLRRGCCSCRSTGCRTRPRAAPCATGRCRRWPPGCGRAATC